MEVTSHMAGMLTTAKFTSQDTWDDMSMCDLGCMPSLKGTSLTLVLAWQRSSCCNVHFGSFSQVARCVGIVLRGFSGFKDRSRNGKIKEQVMQMLDSHSTYFFWRCYGNLARHHESKTHCTPYDRGVSH